MADLPALEIRHLNIPRVQQAIRERDEGRFRNRILSAEAQGAERSERARQHIPGALAGDEEAMSRLAQQDLEAATKIRDFVSTASKEERALAKEKAGKSARLALSVMRVDPVQQPVAYQRALETARGEGLDVTGLPETFHPNVLPHLEQIATMGMTTEQAIDYFDQEDEKRAPSVETVYDETTGRERKMVWNPRTSQYEPIGGIKSTTGDLTAPQVANNSEIDSARQALTELQRSLPPGASLAEELRRRMSQFDPLTGLETPDYNSYWGRLGWLAMQSKTGGDPDAGAWSQRLMRAAPTGAGAPVAAAPAPEEGGGFFEGLLGGAAEAATPSPAPAPPSGRRATGPAPSARPTARRPAGRGRLMPGARTSAQPTTAQPISEMSLDGLAELLESPDLTSEDRAAIDARLSELGY